MELKFFMEKRMNTLDYDKVVIATHADEALKIIKNPTADEKEILKNFKYRENIAVIHFDEKYYAKKQKAWCSWNSSMSIENIEKTSVTYWLNQLQNLKIDKNIFLTINPFREIPKIKYLKK